MKFNVKTLAAVSAMVLLAACNPSGDKSSDSDQHGRMTSDGTPGSGSGCLDKGCNVADRVFFGYNSSVIDSEAQATLQKQATYLRGKSELSITVEGHCDERGTREYNLALGERRANAAKNYLVNLGVESSRIQTISYGKERPAVTGDDESAWSQNRRAVTVTANQ